MADLTRDEWDAHYSLEDELLEIYRKEEEYWRQWGSFNWVLFGDANTTYLQAIANAWRRRCTIPLHGMVIGSWRTPEKSGSMWTASIRNSFPLDPDQALL
ncbi:putative NOT transcription complex subunit VIP2 [Hordeum vulgare]|nr:putative NOT transcription complex subunit VIP2 [Hordeum vulgare]